MGKQRAGHDLDVAGNTILPLMEFFSIVPMIGRELQPPGNLS